MHDGKKKKIDHIFLEGGFGIRREQRTSGGDSITFDLIGEGEEEEEKVLHVGLIRQSGQGGSRLVD